MNIDSIWLNFQELIFGFCYDEAENRPAGSLELGNFPIFTDSVFSKLPWVMSRLKSDFFVEVKFTNLDLALTSVFKNLLLKWN